MKLKIENLQLVLQKLEMALCYCEHAVGMDPELYPTRRARTLIENDIEAVSNLIDVLTIAEYKSRELKEHVQ